MKENNLRDFDALLDRYYELLQIWRKAERENNKLKKQLTKATQRAESLNRNIEETKRISAILAKKTTDEAILKALSTYVSRAKRKTAESRPHAKIAALDFAKANGVTIPDDLMESIVSLDEEQPEPKVVNVAGDYNDIHDNKEVKM